MVYLVNLLNVWCKQVLSAKQPELGHDSGSFCTLVVMLHKEISTKLQAYHFDIVSPMPK